MERDGRLPPGLEPEPAGRDPEPGSQPRASASATGFHKPLPAGGRLARMWAAVGLWLGRRLAFVVRDDHIFLILMAAVVGITSGGAAGLLLWWIRHAVALFPHPQEEVAWLRWTVFIAIPVAGGLLAGGLRVAAKRFLATPLCLGVPGVMHSIAGQGGTIRARGAAIVGIGTGLTMGSGGSSGHEGPSVAIGAAVGSALARFVGLRMRRHMAMVGAGCAGGLAAAFNAPLAGVIFTVEIVFAGSIGGNVGTMSVFIPLIVAAVAGTFTSHAIQGDELAFVTDGHAQVGLVDLGFYVVLAIAAGVLGSAMGRGILAVERRFDGLRIPEWVKPAVGALGVGLIAATFTNDVLGPGHSVVERALRGDLLWKTALLLIVLKIAATALTVGSGGFGGAFLPSLYVGACLGTAVAAAAHFVFPAAQPPGAYALVGMGAIFAALMHAPLTPIVMLFELTHDWGVILPLMLCCILSVVVSRRVHDMNFYRQVLRGRGVMLEREAEGEVMRRGIVRQLMGAPPLVLTRAAGMEEIRRAILKVDLQSIFVVDEGGAVVGFINGNVLAKRLLEGEVQPESRAQDVMAQDDVAMLYPQDTLAGAMLAFARSGQEALPVVDNERRLLGILRRGDLLVHYSDKVLGEREEVLQVHAEDGLPDQEFGLGKGLVLERIVVGRHFAGHSLAELELRRRVGVTVLEWTRGDLVIPVQPQKPLREGDVLAVCGTREQLLRARSLD